MAARGIEHDRLEDAVAAAERYDQAQAIEQQIRMLESSDHGGGRGTITHDDEDERRAARRDIDCGRTTAA